MKRNKEIKIRLNDKESAVLGRNVAKSGLSREAYLRALIVNKQIFEIPPVDYFETLKLLRQINVSLNQIAVRADSLGIIDTKEYWKNIYELQSTVGELKKALSKRGVNH